MKTASSILRSSSSSYFFNSKILSTASLALLTNITFSSAVSALQPIDGLTAPIVPDPIYKMNLSDDFTNVAALKNIPNPYKIGTQYVVMDAETGEVLIGKKSNIKRQPASLTKMMTLAVAFHVLDGEKFANFKPDTQVIIPDYAKIIRDNPRRIKRLWPMVSIGKEYSLADLMKISGHQSGAFSTVAVANQVTLSLGWTGDENERIDKFKKLMNKLARNIGMKNSNFTTLAGEPDDKNISTPTDIAKLIQHLWKKFPKESEIYLGQARPKYETPEFKKLSSSRQRRYNRHSNNLIRNGRVGGIHYMFGKTGYVNESKSCLGVMTEMYGRKVIAVTFGNKGSKGASRTVQNILSQARSKVRKLNKMNYIPVSVPIPTPRPKN